MKSSKHPFLRYLLVYTLVSGVFLSVILAGFSLSGKSFIYEARMGDGLKQHYVSLAYLGHYLRDVLKTLFTEHRLHFPMWDFHIGYGSDILTTLHYYAIGDPLNLLSVAVPYKYTEYLYDALLLLRIYLAGVTFSLYSRYHKNGYFPTLLGAVLYAFCQWSFVAGFKHPFFLNPGIYFPLLLIGVDKIYKKERPYLYILALAVSALSNFYFFYMLGIFTVIYAVYRYFMVFGKIRIRELGFYLGRFALFSLIGVLIASVIFFPTLGAVLGTDRIGAVNYIMSSYRTVYYHRLIPALIGKFEGHFTIIGISAVGILGVLLLFTLRKKFTAMKIGFLMCMCFLCIPYIAHMLNGFSYVTNRWCWAFTMLMSYIFVKLYPEFFHLTSGQLYGILGVLGLWGIYVFADVYARNDWNLASILLVFGFWAVFSLGYPWFRKKKILIPLLLFTGISAGTLLNMYQCFFCPENDDVHTSQFADTGSAYSKNVTKVQEVLSRMEDMEDYRFDQVSAGILQNGQVMSALNGGQFFFSLANGDVSRFQNELYPCKPMGQNFYNLNSRAFLMKLFSMKYQVGGRQFMPYGYEPVKRLKSPDLMKGGAMRSIFIYEDPDALPFAYTYDSSISCEDFLAMNVMQRQQALMQGVVLEESSLKTCEPKDTSRELDYVIRPVRGCEISDQKITATENDAVCVLEFSGLSDSELYLVFDELHYQPVTRKSAYSDKEWEALSGKEQREIEIKDEKVTNDFYFTAAADIDGRMIDKKIHVVTDRNNFYNGRHNFSNNLGYSSSPVNKIYLTIQRKGSYSFEDLSVYCQPMDRFSKYTADRKEDRVENLTTDYGDVSCQISLKERKALVFSIPYSKGWKAVVDGKEMELKKANTMFMALELEPGTHEVSLHYSTPHIRLFLLLSAVGCLAFAALVFYTERKLKKEM